MCLFFSTFYRAILLAFRCCSTLSQAVAFNMFLAFFPMLLLILALLRVATGPVTGQEDIIAWLRMALPPGTHQVVVDFLSRSNGHPWHWAMLGLTGFLLAGSQAIHLLMDGFRQLTGDTSRPPFWTRHIRALLLLLLTIVPWLAAVLLTVFGKQARGWLINHFGLPMLVRTVWSGLFIAAVLLMAMLVVAVLYRAGCPGLRSWNQVLPGAALATVLWWAVNSALGFFVARVPYTLAYGGLAAAIGLIIWMQLTAIVVFIGAAFNSLRASSASSAPLR